MDTEEIKAQELMQEIEETAKKSNLTEKTLSSLSKKIMQELMKLPQKLQEKVLKKMYAMTEMDRIKNRMKYEEE